MRRLVPGTALVLVCFALAGLLPQSREFEELTLLTELAADRRGGEVVLTALVGKRGTEGEEPELFTGRGPDLPAAVADLTDRPLRQPYLGQVETLYVGEGLTEELGQLLYFVLDHPQLKTDTAVYIVEGDAGELLELRAGETDTRPRDREAVTVGEVLARLARGWKTALPVYEQQENRVVRGGERDVQ